MTQADADAVYAAGWDEQALHDAVAVCALFNFMNRYVQGLGIPADEAFFDEAGRRLHDFGYQGFLPLLVALAGWRRTPRANHGNVIAAALESAALESAALESKEAGMRGEDRSSGSLFSYVELERRVAGTHPLRAIWQIVNEVLASLSGEFEGLYSDTGRPSIAPEKAAAGLAASGFLLDPLGTPADRATGLQPAVSLVCGPGHGRCGLGRHGVLQEPGPAAGGGGCGEALGRCGGAPEGSRPLEAGSISRWTAR